MCPSASASQVMWIGSASSWSGFVQLAPPSGDCAKAMPRVQPPRAHECGVKYAYVSARCPGREGSAASPGIIASSVDVGGATGTRTGAVHATPSFELETTMSFALHEGRKRQSAHD